MAIRDITELMSEYRECSRNLWNVYFAKRKDVGGSLDDFERVRRVLFESLVLNDFEDWEDNAAAPTITIVPRPSSPILIRRQSTPGEAGYWDEVRDMVVGPGDIELAFVDYFDFSQAPIKDYRYFLCKIQGFASHPEYEEREALLEVLDSRAFHAEGLDLR